jgi:hypothetical protein
MYGTSTVFPFVKKSQYGPKTFKELSAVGDLLGGDDQIWPRVVAL